MLHKMTKYTVIYTNLNYTKITKIIRTKVRLSVKSNREQDTHTRALWSCDLDLHPTTLTYELDL